MISIPKFGKIFLIVFLLITASGCSLKKSANSTAVTPANQLTDQDNQAVLTKSQANLAKAKLEATAWEEDATFVGYNFTVPTDSDPKSLIETFVFGSKNAENLWWTSSINSNGKATRALVYKDDFLGKDLQPISEQFWKTAYPNVLKTAEINGGITFKSANPGAIITITMSQIEPRNWLWYIVSYKGTSTEKNIRISANDGKIYDAQGNLVSQTKAK